MDKKTMVSDPIEAGELFLKELGSYYPIELAFWRRDQGERHDYLYVASKKIDDENMRAAYREVHQIIDGLTNVNLDSYRIRLLAWNSPSTKRAVSTLQKTGEVMDIFVGPEVVEDVFVYPIGVASPPSRTPRKSSKSRPK
jgi:hypothetical protein